MTTKQPVYMVDIFTECCDAMRTGTVLSNAQKPYSTYGRVIQILDYLQTLNNSISNGGNKYPLIALYQDFPERRGVGYYAQVTIPKIVIACLTTDTDSPPDRYYKTFKPILYHIYYEFLRQLSIHSNIVEREVDLIEHTKWDRIGTVRDGQSEYIDSIEITNLKLTLSQTKTC